MSKPNENKDNQISQNSTGIEENNIFSNFLATKDNNVNEKNITIENLDLGQNFYDDGVVSPFMELFDIKDNTDDNVFEYKRTKKDKKKVKVAKNFLKKKRKNNIDFKNAFDKEEEKFEYQYCKKEPRVIKFTKRFRKSFKINEYKKKKISIKSIDSNMIGCNEEINNNNINNEFNFSQSVNSNDYNSFYSNLGEFSPTISIGDEMSEIEEKTRIFTNFEENPSFCLSNSELNYLNNLCEFRDI